jgi:hypothetical protein
VLSLVRIIPTREDEKVSRTSSKHRIRVLQRLRQSIDAVRQQLGVAGGDVGFTFVGQLNRTA